MNPPLATSLVLVLLLVATSARADTFTIQPDGSVLLETSLMTRGVFTCMLSQCSGSGTNSVTLGTGASTATITFTGLDTSIDVTNRASRVSLGTFEGSAMPGFTFPERRNENNPVLSFHVFVTQGAPIADTTRKGWPFGPGGGVVLPVLGGTSHFSLPIPENDSGFGYTAVVYTVRPFPFAIPSEGSLNLTADVGLVPEPATLILFSSGLAGVAMARRRKRAASPNGSSARDSSPAA
jgi:hypothetical protein